MTIDARVQGEKIVYDLNRKVPKIFALLAGDID